MAVELLTNVIIGGQTTAGFNALAGRLQSLGATVDKIGRYVREFEQESVQVYRSYEDNMLAAEYALSAQYDSATELSKVMQGLDQYASEWAATTIFHTDDVSKAINEAAHAGWDYTEIVKGIPQAMLIAQAGGMELSDGLDYLVKMMNTTNTSFDDMGTLIDQWAKAANLSATDINEMGEAFMSLSASAMFADNTQELFTMLAVLANAGVTGSKAGTLIRNAMMRVVAPTDKAKKAMAELGATEEELASWTGASDTAEQLEKLGFSAYDATTGELKPMRDILISLHDSISGMNEEARYDILSTIFPLRSINAATAFYNAIESGEFDKVFAAIGDSEGYAAEGSEIMMSGLTGAIETLASKWEEFQRQVGETLAPAIENVAGWLGNIMDAVNNMDDASLSALVSGMTTLAGLGPALLIGGAAIKMFTTLGPWGTAFVVAAIGASALAGYLSKISEINFKENFGTMQLDLDELGKHVDSLGTKFTTQQEAIATWEAALETAESAYATKSSQLSELLLTDVLEGKTLSDADKKKIFDYASEIRQATLDGIENAEASDKSFLQALFSDRGTGEAEEQAYNTAANVVDNYYSGLYEEAYSIGAEMRAQMTAALQDGSLDEGERQAIMASVDRLNQINAAIASTLDKEAFYTQLYKAQSVSWDTAKDYVAENEAKMAADLASLEDTYSKKWGHYRAAYEYAAENGTEFTDLDGNKYTITPENFDTYWNQFETQFNREKGDAIQSVKDKYGELNFAMMDALMNDSEYGDAWKFMRGLGQNAEGGFDFTDAFAGMSEADLNKLNGQLSDMWAKGSELFSRLGLTQDTDQYDYFAQLFEQDGNAAREASQWSSDLWLYGLGNVPTQANMDVWAQQANLNSLLEQRANLENQISQTEARMAANNYSIFNANGYHNDWTKLNGTNGDGGGLLDQKAQLDLDIEAAEAELERLKALAAEPVTEPVATELDTTSVDTWIPPTKYGKVIYKPGGMTPLLYAEGGRADTPSIFGEAGPEWAIPEEHSERTAQLLDAARQASGFTWGDLLSRFGGLNANPGGQSLVVHYSPTINAQNAEGVERALSADKNRLLKLVRQMLDEQRTRDEVEVYA